MKSAEQILEEKIKIRQGQLTGILWTSTALDAMQEYANQFRKPAVSGNEVALPSELKARELLFEMELAIEQGATKEIQAKFCFNVMMNTILQEIKRDAYWQSVMRRGNDR